MDVIEKRFHHRRVLYNAGAGDGATPDNAIKGSYAKTNWPKHERQFNKIALLHGACHVEVEAYASRAAGAALGSRTADLYIIGYTKPSEVVAPAPNVEWYYPKGLYVHKSTWTFDNAAFVASDTGYNPITGLADTDGLRVFVEAKLIAVPAAPDESASPAWRTNYKIYGGGNAAGYTPRLLVDVRGLTGVLCWWNNFSNAALERIDCGLRCV